MTKDELPAKLQSIERSDIEFKESAWAAPREDERLLILYDMALTRSEDGA